MARLTREPHVTLVDVVFFHTGRVQQLLSFEQLVEISSHGLCWWERRVGLSL